MRLEGLERIRLGVETVDELLAAQDRKESHHRAGSYPELEDALLWLEARHSVLYRAFWQYIVVRQSEDVTGTLRSLLDAACELLASRMPPRIRVPAAALSEARVGNGRHANGWARGRRNEEIRKRYAQGESLTSLAARFGLQRRTVEKLTRPIRDLA